MKSNTVTVSGNRYRASTGQLVSVSHAQQKTSTSVHGRVKKSQTLNRRYVKRPEAVRKKTLESTSVEPQVPQGDNIKRVTANSHLHSRLQSSQRQEDSVSMVTRKKNNPEVLQNKKQVSIAKSSTAKNKLNVKNRQTVSNYSVEKNLKPKELASQRFSDGFVKNSHSSALFAAVQERDRMRRQKLDEAKQKVERANAGHGFMMDGLVKSSASNAGMARAKTTGSKAINQATYPSVVTKVESFSKPQVPRVSEFTKQNLKKDMSSIRVSNQNQSLEARLSKVRKYPTQQKNVTSKKHLAPSHVLKKTEMSKAETLTKPAQIPKKNFYHKKSFKIGGVASFVLAFVMLGGYLSYMTVPTLSTQVAAAQAGIDATYPQYKPSGYTLSGPVAFGDGEVKMQFRLNGDNRSYTVSQKSTNWDSQAVLTSYIMPKAGQNYSVTQGNGLTIYTYHGNAAWVSGGILYTISGDAPLSSSQIKNIATSM